MTLQGFIIFLLIGAVAGWLAGKCMRGGGFGLLINIILGILGGILGGWLLGLLGANWAWLGKWYGQIFTSCIGAIIILWVASLFKK
ncbi:MAG: GlsB/YeaQ/YmgE family stress response membrane protein [Bacteroidales bacterium]|jgi:uncharacterized membrane protein YeaQ/YmgE (transglycosylase-associated protein family)|nr:GlsB/YeaQ/YmgE family stress response membrane protein [Bacteroidales bacterium]MBQ5487101.1 GlsB/YeaQ/YmgE family stress response membrane protein [Bacteroidales bacterium]MBR5396660.1 GlsB/YeaQ/YmgE family stress response membrane protein [Bacteroidales bacterium]